jgi:hypothetical protein
VASTDEFVSDRTAAFDDRPGQSRAATLITIGDGPTTRSRARILGERPRLHVCVAAARRHSSHTKGKPGCAASWESIRRGTWSAKMSWSVRPGGSTTAVRMAIGLGWPPTVASDWATRD